MVTVVCVVAYKADMDNLHYNLYYNYASSAMNFLVSLLHN